MLACQTTEASILIHLIKSTEKNFRLEVRETACEAWQSVQKGKFSIMTIAYCFTCYLFYVCKCLRFESKHHLYFWKTLKNVDLMKLRSVMNENNKKYIVLLDQIHGIYFYELCFLCFNIISLL